MTNKVSQRINFVTEYFYPANNAPGARFKPLVDEFIASRIEVVIYTSKVSSQLKEYSVKTNLIGFPSNQRSAFVRLIQELTFGIETFIRLMFSKGEIYYITSPSFINCTLAYWYCKLFNKKYILDIRDDYPSVYFDSGLISEKGFIGKILIRIEKDIYTHSFILIAATNGLKTNLEKVYNGYNKEIWLLRNGYSEKLFFPSTIKYKEFTLVFHGIISRYQDIDLLIELGHLIDKKNLPFKIIVVGQGNQDYKLKSEIPKSINYLGPKSYDKIPEIISKAHIGLSFRQPGKISEDSFPVKIYEYIGVSIPVIVTPSSEAGKYVEQNKIGFQYNSDQKEILLDKIIEISKNKQLYDELLSNLSNIRNQFSREKNSKALVGFVRTKIHAVR